jgi:GTP pyrophosphokinase
MNIAKLKEIGKKLYSEKDLNFSINLYKKTINLNLDEQSATIAFFLRADIENNSKREIIQKNFSKDFFEKIELLQRISKISFSEKEKRIKEIRENFLELSDDYKTIIIKLIERLETLKEAEILKLPVIKKLSEEVLYFYSTIAHRLGISKIYTEMEDVSFRNLFKKEYAQIERIMAEKRGVYKEKLEEMSDYLKILLIKNKIKAKFQQRVKRNYSIYRKIKNKGVDFNNIYDIMAIRVITDSIESCYHALGLIHSQWYPIEGRFRDWIVHPKPNGYRALQTTVITKNGDRFEIQIRTEDMHREAEFGAAAHWSYKEGHKGSKAWFNRLREFLQNDEIFENPFEILENIQSEIKKDYISVLTPKGDIISLPEGATILDFAYAVHSEVGNHTIGGKVNKRFSSIKKELKSGDIIEVITNNKAKPSRDWLKIVKTSKAKTKIREWFRKNEKHIFINEGKKIWEKSIRRYKSKFEGFDNEANFRKNLNQIGYKTNDDLFFALGCKSIKGNLSLLKKLYPLKSKKEIKRIKEKKKNLIRKSPTIIIEGEDNIDFVLAKCCNPIKGEEIIGYMTKSSGLKIHSKNCLYIKRGYFEKERIRKAKWVMDESLQILRIKIIGEDYQKIVSVLIELTDILNFSIDLIKKELSKTGNEIVYVEISIGNISVFNKIKEKMKQKKFIYEVEIVK